MPVIPTFSAFASTPDLGGVYTRAAAVASETAQAAARIELEKQKLSAAAVQNQMELNAKMAVAEQNARVEQQQMEVDAAYKQATLGFRQRELDNAEQLSNMKMAEFAREAMASQMFQKRFSELGGDEDAARKAVLEMGPIMGGGGFSAALRSSENGGGSIEGLGEISDIPGRPDLQRFRSGPHSYQIAPKPTAVEDEATPIQGAPGMVRIGNRVARLPESVDQKLDMQDLRVLQEEHAKDPGKMASQRRKAGEKLSKTQTVMADEYDEREKRINELKSKLRSGGAVTSGKPQKVGRFTFYVTPNGSESDDE